MAYRASDTPQLSELWKGIVAATHNALVVALEQGDPEQLAHLLSSMFQQAYLSGISSSVAYGTTFPKWYFSSFVVETLVSLGEALGVVNAECPEQGEIGHVFRRDLSALIAGIESLLGIGISFPNIGAPYGIEFGDVLITVESPEHIYVAHRISQVIDQYLVHLSKPPHIVEVGAGFGGTAYWLLTLRQLEISSYTIIDLPTVNAFQGYFLGNILGYDNIVLYGEEERRPDGQYPRVAIYPPQVIDDGQLFNEEKPNLCINQNSMPEMPAETVLQYLKWIKANVDGVFYSYNQEGTALVGTMQHVVVPEVARQAGLVRVSRNLSWLRQGYVEEVYTVDLH